MKKHLSTILLSLLFLIGLSLLLYPVVSDYWNSLHQSRVIMNYEQQLAEVSREDEEKCWAEAVAYNQRLFSKADRYEMTPEEEEEYNQQLNLTGNGVMGYIEIPSIQVSLPLYHGTSEAVLQAGIGHLEGSSLPVGGESTHSVLSGHRGLPSAKLFSNLDKMNVGDVFYLHIAGRTLEYTVDQLLVVLPNEVEALNIEEGKDYCTLVTCTPYGINSHRMLVRGARSEYDQKLEVYVASDAYQLDPVLVMPFVAAPLFIIVLIWLLLSTSPSKRKNLSNSQNITEKKEESHEEND